MRQVALAVLQQGGRVWLASDKTDATRELAESLAPEGPIDFYAGQLQQEGACDQLVDLIYQTDGYLDVLIQLVAPSEPSCSLLEEKLHTTFFKPQGKGHIVRWAWRGELPTPAKASQTGPRVHALIAPPTEAAIPHILHLASPAAGSLEDTALSVIG